MTQTTTIGITPQTARRVKEIRHIVQDAHPMLRITVPDVIDPMIEFAMEDSVKTTYLDAVAKFARVRHGEKRDDKAEQAPPVQHDPIPDGLLQAQLDSLIQEFRESAQTYVHDPHRVTNRDVMLAALSFVIERTAHDKEFPQYIGECVRQMRGI